MTIQVTVAPCCWGVDDIKNPHLPDWCSVLDEATAAGYSGLELGPYGYMPLDSSLVSEALISRDLFIVAGTIFDDLVDADNYETLLRQTREICALITQLPRPPKFEGQQYAAPYLTVMDWGHDERDYTAGHAERAPRLREAEWAIMLNNITAICQTARDEFGVRAVIHPHAGGYIEFADELEKIAASITADVAGLCLDTGHCYYSGMDPLATLQRYRNRLEYIHFKDVNPLRYNEVMRQRIRFFDACAQGVMCPIGDGVIDYPAIFEFLASSGYQGFITVEQERDPRHCGGSLVDVRQSREFLRTIGFTD